MTPEQCSTLREGDAVLCVYPEGDYCGQFSNGTVYRIGGHYFKSRTRYEMDCVLIEKDDRGRPNGWACKYFELAGGPW